MIFDTQNYVSLPQSEIFGTTTTSVKTLLTITELVFGLSTFGLAVSLVLTVEFFHVYFPKYARSTRIKDF